MITNEFPVAIVTGAARGIGRACVDALLSDGWAVGAIDIAFPPGARASAERNWLAVTADVREPSDVEAALTIIDSTLGTPQACVNAAGIYPPSTIWTADKALYERVFGINFWGTLCVSQAVARRMVATSGGSIVNLASVDAFAASPEQVLYSASKTAVVGLTRSLALSLVGASVRVNAVAPAWVDTEGIRETGRLGEGIETIPMKRAARPEEIAALVVWLVSGKGAQFITGETILASGGLVMR